MRVACLCCGSQVEAGTVCPVDGHLARMKAESVHPFRTMTALAVAGLDSPFVTEAAGLEHEEAQPVLGDAPADYINNGLGPEAQLAVTREEDAEGHD